MKKYISITLALLLSMQAMLSSAAVYRLDDSGTIVGKSLTKMDWQHPSKAKGEFYQLQGQVLVNAKINVRQWNGKTAKIYMAMERAPINNLVVSWKSNGLWIPGVIRNDNTTSQRALIFNGAINSDYLTETLSLSITADGRSYAQAQNLKFYFEIEM
jgi:hypothetical protein